MQERQEAARQRKSLAQKRLWQNPEYRQRQVQRIRDANNGGGGRAGGHAQKPPRLSVAQLQRARTRNRQQLLQAQELVPQLEQVVEKLREQVCFAAVAWLLCRMHHQ